MTTRSYHKVSITLPNQLNITAEVPANLDPALAELSVRALLGALSAIAITTDPEVRRDFLIRFTAASVNNADSAVRSVQSANSMIGQDSKRAIDELLKNLHHQ